MTYELFLASDTPFSKHLGVGKISKLGDGIDFR